MKRKLISLALSTAAIFSMTSFVLAQEETKTLLGDTLKSANISVSGSTAYFSKYIWRGIRLDEDPVIQPSLTISAFNGWAFNIWSSFDIDNEDAFNSDEVDSTLTYTHSFENLGILGKKLKPVTVTLGHTYYDFPGTNTFSRETILGVGYGIFLNPTVTWYHDYGTERQGGGKGDYILLSLSHSLTIIPDYGITLDLSANAGYNDNMYISGVGGNVLLTGGLTIPLTKSLKMQPSVSWSSPSGDVRHESAGNHNDYVYGGVVLNYSL